MCDGIVFECKCDEDSRCRPTTSSTLVFCLFLGWKRFRNDQRWICRPHVRQKNVRKIINKREKSNRIECVLWWNQFVQHGVDRLSPIHEEQLEYIAISMYIRTLSILDPIYRYLLAVLLTSPIWVHIQIWGCVWIYMNLYVCLMVAKLGPSIWVTYFELKWISNLKQPRIFQKKKRKDYWMYIFFGFVSEYDENVRVSFFFFLFSLCILNLYMCGLFNYSTGRLYSYACKSITMPNQNWQSIFSE